MNTLTLPPSANWFLSKIAACAPDNTLVYGAMNSIVVIKPAPYDRPADVTVIPFAHLDKVLCLSIAPAWSPEQPIFASMGADKIVKVWNVGNKDCIYSHKAHMSSRSNPVGVAFMSNIKTVSVSEDGLIVIWKMTTNEIKSHKNLLGMKAHVTTLATCPHVGTLTAFGLRSGLVIIYDFSRATPHLVYKLKNHEKEVLDLAWCPQPINVIPESTHKPRKKHIKDTVPTVVEQEADVSFQVVEIDLGKNTDVVPESETIPEADTIDALPANGSHIQCAIAQGTLDQLSSSTPKSTKLPKKNLWVGLKHADDDELNASREPIIPGVLDTTEDFLSECLALKAKITETFEAEADAEITLDDSEPTPKKEKRKILKPMRKHENKQVNEENSTESKVLVQELLQDPLTPAISTSVDVISDAAENNTSPSPGTSETTENEELIINTSTQPKPDLLLASSSRGGGIVICCAGTDGHKIKHMKLPKPRDSRNYRNYYNAFMALNWIAPDTILSSGSQGELFSWHITDESCTPKLIHCDHTRQLFCIASPFAFPSVTNATEDDFATWSFGPDRNIFYTTLKERKVMSCYPTFPTGIQVVAASPIDPGRLALGLNDGYIRIWDLNKAHNQYIEMTQIYTRVGKCKVTALAWHSTDEFVVGFGTDDGQVGFINAGQYTKPPTYFTQHFLTAIYKIEWGPIAGKDIQGLYVCSTGSIGIYDSNAVNAPPTIIPTPKGERISQFAWKSDHSKFAIGCKNGNVFILSPKYDVLKTLYYQKQTILRLAWHPMQTMEDEDVSKNHDLLASTASDCKTVVYDLSKLSEDSSAKDAVIGILGDHIKPVNDMFWSPYKNGQLVTVSEDGTAIIWNNMEPVSTFINNAMEPLLCGIWSPIHEDYILTAGKDSTLRIWNSKDHPIRVQQDIAQERSARKKQLLHSVALKDSDESIDTVKSRRIAPLMPNLSGRQANLETAIGDCRLLFQQRRGGGDDFNFDDNSVLKLFGDPQGVIDIIDEENELQVNKRKLDLHHHLALWKGDIGEVIKRAINEGTLTPWLLSIAPMVSFKLWQDAIVAYAVQLTESINGDPIEIASFYLAQHKIDEAINILRTRLKHREALVLAKYKKPDDKQLHKEIITQWLGTCINTGRYELGAQCHLSQGEFEEAAKLLYKRSEPQALKLAKELAQHAGNHEFAKSIDVQCETNIQQGEQPTPLRSRIAVELAACSKIEVDAADADDDGDHRKRKRGEKTNRVLACDDDVDKEIDDTVGQSDSATDNGVGKKAKDITNDEESTDTVDSSKESAKAGYDSDNKENVVAAGNDRNAAMISTE